MRALLFIIKSLNIQDPIQYIKKGTKRTFSNSQCPNGQEALDGIKSHN